MKEQKTIELKFKYNEEKYANTNIDELCLSTRANNVLHRNGIDTLIDLINKWDIIADLRSCGKNTVKEIKNTFIKYYCNELSDSENKKFWENVKQLIS